MFQIQYVMKQDNFPSLIHKRYFSELFFLSLLSLGAYSKLTFLLFEGINTSYYVMDPAIVPLPIYH
jgi:hypothetical protein